MNASDFLDAGLRLLVVVGLACGAWRSWKALGHSVRLDGRRYYRQPDGTYRTFWGGRVRDPSLMRRIEEVDPARGAADGTRP